MSWLRWTATWTAPQLGHSIATNAASALAHHVGPSWRQKAPTVGHEFVSPHGSMSSPGKTLFPHLPPLAHCFEIEDPAWTFGSLSSGPSADSEVRHFKPSHEEASC